MHSNLVDLSLFFTNPVVYGEVDPRTLALHEAPRVHWHSSSLDDLFHTIKFVISSHISDKKLVAVALSGGVDSFFVLRLCRDHLGPEHVTAIYFAAHNDHSIDITASLTRQIDLLAPGCQLEIVHEESATFLALSGPPPHALPDAAIAIEERAAFIGADLLLTGNGADEILNPPKYIGAPLLRQGRFLQAASQLFQSERTGVAGFLEEFIAPVLLHRSTCPPQVRLAFSYEELIQPTATQLLRDEFREYAENWCQMVYKKVSDACLRTSSSVSEMDAFLSVFPVSRHSSLTGIPVKHPFQDQEVIKTALEVPFSERVGPPWMPVDKRRKAAYLRMMGSGELSVMPSKKISYTKYYESASFCKGEHLKEIGLIRPDADVRKWDLSTRMNVAKVDKWLERTVRNGAEMV